MYVQRARFSFMEMIFVSVCNTMCVCLCILWRVFMVHDINDVLSSFFFLISARSHLQSHLYAIHSATIRIEMMGGNDGKFVSIHQPNY